MVGKIKLMGTLYNSVAATTISGLDLIFLLIGLSIVIDIIIISGSLRVLRIRKVRIVHLLLILSSIIMVYLILILLNLLDFISVPGTYAGILLAFLILLVFYAGILRGIS